ncbi:AN1-like Zinc finger [Oesophagostomum dentatum]|nr:AN1-like Zinc finger [Oesophagostomum dentatum]
MAEMEQKMKELTLPPSNMEELNALKAQREAKLRTMCKVCRRKLSIMEQEMSCACSYVFCKEHRDPDRHLCYIDHRQTGRHKILKENPRIEDGGLHKAKTPTC